MARQVRIRFELSTSPSDSSGCLDAFSNSLSRTGFGFAKLLELGYHVLIGYVDCELMPLFVDAFSA
jgi:hypothetical protein